MIKRIVPILIAAAGVFILFFSCDKIEPPYRESTTNTTDSDTVYRKVLIEDFTGHRCGNCPKASDTAQYIKRTYPGKVVIIAVHAGYFANVTAVGTTMEYDFRTPEGTVLDNFFGISTAGNPNGMVSRIDYPAGTNIKAFTTWEGFATTIFSLPPDVKIKITNTYNSSTRILGTEIKTTYLNSLDSIYMLCVYIIEDSIVKPQIDYRILTGNDTVYNYLHHDALRGAINSTWGDTLSNGAVNAGTLFTNNYSYTLPAAWNDAHCSVVAFLRNAATQEILQVEEAKVR